MGPSSQLPLCKTQRTYTSLQPTTSSRARATIAPSARKVDPRGWKCETTLSPYTSQTSSATSHQCNVCAKEFRSKNALKVHNATVHNVKGDSTYRAHNNPEQNWWLLSKQELHSTSIEPSLWKNWDNWIILFQFVNENSFGLYPLISAMTLNSPSDLLNYVEQCEVGFQCSICGKTSGSKREARNHVESIHFPSSFVYECDHCGRQFNSLNTRNVHISRNHKKKDLMMEGMMWLENSSSSINLSKWALFFSSQLWTAYMVDRRPWMTP